MSKRAQVHNLTRAYDQAGEYFDALPESDRPRYILVSDFRTFELHDLDDRKTIVFDLEDLPKHVKDFRFILDLHRRRFRGQRPTQCARRWVAETVGGHVSRRVGLGGGDGYSFRSGLRRSHELAEDSTRRENYRTARAGRVGSSNRRVNGIDDRSLGRSGIRKVSTAIHACASLC